ncbi:hypothetical protein B0H14DRAFT_3095677 [Mycena olivaceomarginata]|nr:hypothetical protein B0H14DRAFT_3095677 [Mycena olivaceomarginata]
MWCQPREVPRSGIADPLMGHRRPPGAPEHHPAQRVFTILAEHLWYDVMHGFGQKWKNFFHNLEINHGLNPRSSVNIWLLHHLFLASVHQHALDPRNMFIFSMVQDGPRGIRHLVEPVDEPVDNIASYGVDWAVANEPHLMCHLLEQNLQDWENENPFHTPPTQLSDIPCKPPTCPFTPQQLLLLDETLAQRVDVESWNMVLQRMVWCEVFSICNYFSQQSL